MSKGWFLFWLTLAGTLMLVCLVWLLSTKGSGCVPGIDRQC
jgi:hypothetical protein